MNIEIINLPTLIALAVIFLEIPLGAFLCSYVSVKRIAVANVILGILGALVSIILGDTVSVPPQYSAIFLIMLPFYIYIPNLIVYFKMRSIRKRSGVGKEIYSFKRNAGIAAILTACHFPTLFIAYMLSIVVVVQY